MIKISFIKTIYAQVKKDMTNIYSVHSVVDFSEIMGLYITLA